MNLQNVDQIDCRYSGGIVNTKDKNLLIMKYYRENVKLTDTIESEFNILMHNSNYDRFCKSAEILFCCCCKSWCRSLFDTIKNFIKCCCSCKKKHKNERYLIV